MRITVSVESTNDLSKELIEKYGIKVIPYGIVLGDKAFKDGEISAPDLFRMVEETGILPKTNAINEYEYTEYFESLKKDCDAVIHITLSGELSSSSANAFRAAKNVNGVYVIDSRSLSTGIGLLAISASELASEGKTAEEIVSILEERKKKLQVSFVIERLDYLYKGGRCNSLAYFGANLLRLRPRIIVDGGKMGADKKYRGHMDKVVAKYCEDVLNESITPDLSMAFVTYTTATEEMINAAKEALLARGFKNVYETHAGCTIASHCGGNTLGILFFNDGKE